MAQRKGVDSQASRMAERTPAAIGGELPLGCEMFCHHTCGGSLSKHTIDPRGVSNSS